MEFEYVDDERQAAEARVGKTLCGKWKLEKLLGMGGMAAVYAARTDDGRLAALKVLHAHLGHRKDIRERFLREGLTANQVQHPGVVRVHDHRVDTDGTAVLVMELLEGESLAQRHQRQELTIEELLDYLEQVLDALVAAHGRGIVHRDLKPDNLFLCTDGKLKILDFGVARVLEDIPGQKHTKTGMTLGTVPFMAPEQALGKRDQIDGRVDLFALGAMAFRILAGRNIHETDSPTEQLVAMATKPAPKLLSVAPHVPHDVCMVVDLALAFAKEARYPDARTMREDVRALRLAQTPPYVAGLTRQREEATHVELMAPSATAAATSAGQPATVVAAPSQALLNATGNSARDAPATTVGEPDRALLAAAGKPSAAEPTTVNAPDAALLALASGREAPQQPNDARGQRRRAGAIMAALAVIGLGGAAFAIGRFSDSTAEHEASPSPETGAREASASEGRPRAAPGLAARERATVASSPASLSKTAASGVARTPQQTKDYAPTPAYLSETRAVSDEPLGKDEAKPRAGDAEPKPGAEAKVPDPAATQARTETSNALSEAKDQPTATREKQPEAQEKQAEAKQKQAEARQKQREKRRRGHPKRRQER